MSLINKMLQDLDERRASELERAGVSRHVRTLPSARSFPWKGVVVAVMSALAGAVIVLLIVVWKLGASPVVVSASPQVSTPAPVKQATASMLAVPVPVTNPAAGQTVPQQQPQRMSRTETTQTPRKAVQGEGQALPLKLDRSFVRIDPEENQSAVSMPEAVRGETAAMPARIERQPRTPPLVDAADTEYRNGMNLARRGAVDEAVNALGAALRIDPRHLAARQALLSLLADRKQWAEAQTLAEEGLAVDPKQSAWAMLVARLQLEHGDADSAVKTMDQYLQYASGNADYLGFHALLLQKTKRLSEAIERYRSALSLRPTEGRWWYGLGITLEASQRQTEAKEVFAQARSCPNLPADLVALIEQKLKAP